MRTIFIVDDEYSIVEALTDLLVEEGYLVVSAANGREALAAITAKPPDLVLTDLMMPTMDGRQLVAQMRRVPTLRRVPVILMSAASLPRVPIEEPEIPVFRKPFEIDVLLAEISRLLARPAGD
jgi:two-component system response regulator VicR